MPKAYDELNQSQTDAGSKFIRELKLSEGDQVVDIGCGTGDVTKYIADIVGPDGEVVGIDPDVARIKIAKEKFNGVSNLQFLVGCSASGFPHDTEPYYDAHISTSAFHWVKNDEKKLYLQKAYRCLKPGGKLAIFCPEVPEKLADGANQADHPDEFCHPLTRDGYRKLFEDLGLFPNVVFEETEFHARFESVGGYERWAKASCYHGLHQMNQSILKDILDSTIHADASVTLQVPNLYIRATKV